MGKNKRNKLGSQTSSNKKKLHGKGARPTGISKPPPSKPSKSSKSSTTPGEKPKQIFHTAPSIPFSPHEHILLVGEGDLSFARSLISHHGCTNVTATVLESEKDLKEKYPHVVENIGVVEEGGGVVKYGVDAGKMKAWTEGRKGAGPGKMDRVFFNFPHVGGKSTDVNRQVRANQEMLVSFFARAIPSLSPRHGSSIIVTLFEGEPYTLWNIRDLARFANLQVAESFKFQAAAYPGYKHVRTLGVVKGKNGETGGGWKGEDRPARSYVFVRKGEGVVMGEGKKKKDESSDDDSEAEASAAEEEVEVEEVEKSDQEAHDNTDIYESD